MAAEKESDPKEKEVKKTTPKKAVPKKAAAPKKKAATKKTTAAKKPAPKKKAPSKKTVATKKATPKKASPKKAATKNVAASKTAAQESPITDSIKKLFSGENKALFIGANLLFLAVIAIVLICVFSGGSGKGMILAFRDSDYEVDLYTVEYGKENRETVRILKNINTSNFSSNLFKTNEGEWLGAISGAQFVPELDKIIFMYKDDGEINIEQMQFGKAEPELLFQTENEMTGFLYLDEGRLMIEEHDNNALCHYSDLKDEAERVVKSDICHIQGPNNFLVEDNDDLFIYDVNRDEEIMLLKDIDDISNYYISDDLSTVAYIVEDMEDEQLFMLDKDGDEIELSDEIDRVARVFFQPGSNDDGLYIGIDKGDPGIYRFSEGNAIIEENYMTYLFDESGKYAIILAGSDYDDITIYSYNMGKDDLVEIYSGEELEFGFSDDPDSIFIVEYDQDDTVIFTCNVSGKGLTKIYDDDLNIANAYKIPGVDKLFNDIYDENFDFSLIVNSLDEEENFVLIEEWHDAQILNYSPDGRYFVFHGKEDQNDDHGLFIVEIKEDADIVELHEVDEDYFIYYNAVFTENGKYVLFSAQTGDAPEDTAVFEVHISGKENAVELFEEAVLEDVEWGDLVFESYRIYLSPATIH